jgi:hypothetical protein
VGVSVALGVGGGVALPERLVEGVLEGDAPGVSGAVLVQQKPPGLARGIGRGAMHQTHMVHRDRAGV